MYPRRFGRRPAPHKPIAAHFPAIARDPPQLRNARIGESFLAFYERKTDTCIEVGQEIVNLRLSRWARSESTSLPLTVTFDPVRRSRIVLAGADFRDDRWTSSSCIKISREPAALMMLLADRLGTSAGLPAPPASSQAHHTASSTRMRVDRSDLDQFPKRRHCLSRQRAAPARARPVFINAMMSGSSRLLRRNSFIATRPLFRATATPSLAIVARTTCSAISVGPREQPARRR